MNDSTLLSVRVPPIIRDILEAKARLARKPFLSYLFDGLCAMADKLPDEFPERRAEHKVSLRGSRKAILTYLAKTDREETISTLCYMTGVSPQTMYLVMRQFVRDDLVQNTKSEQYARTGAPAKWYVISELGRAMVAADEKHAADTLAKFAAKQDALHREIDVPFQMAESQHQYEARVKYLGLSLKYIAMYKLGHEIQSEKDVEWVKQEHARLVSLATAEVAAGKATVDGLVKGVDEKIAKWGGEKVISMACNVGSDFGAAYWAKGFDIATAVIVADSDTGADTRTPLTDEPAETANVGH